MTTSIAGTSLPFPQLRVHPPTSAAATLTTATTLTSSTSVPALLCVKEDKNEKRKSSHQPTPTPLATFIDSVIPDPDRETWNKKVDFLLSVIGFAVDLANVSHKEREREREREKERDRHFFVCFQLINEQRGKRDSLVITQVINLCHTLFVKTLLP
jgi:hypothetical protein